MQRQLRWILAGSVALTALTAAHGATGADTRHEYHLPAENLGNALRAIGRGSATEVIFSPDLVEGKTSPALDGEFTAAEAIHRVLSGSGLVAEVHDGSILIRGRSETAPPEAPDRSAPAIVITGSRIRGAPIASPLITLDQQQIRESGRNSLADVLRDVPQNFSGGQNPGVGLGTTGSFDDSGASTINLRGLGGDATLTVLNGHRLPYNADSQSVDISDIPLGAIDRVEIVPDGASALYGSDAVAGVANIILKRDYTGLDLSARVGTASGGAGSQRQLDATGGTRWASGGFLVAYDFERDFPIVGGDRPYTERRAPGLYLTPSLRHHNALLTAHQQLAPNIGFSVDALYNKRWSELDYALDPSGNVHEDGGAVLTRDETFSISPSLSVTLPAQWKMTLNGVYGQDRDHYAALNYSGGLSYAPFYATYLNRTTIAEMTSDGPLLALPAGDIRVALGAGYRSNTYHENTYDIAARQTDIYGYGELSVPIIAPIQGIWGVRALTANAAVRYERYPHIANVASPKLGMVLSVSRDLDIKASWGKSFKAPTFDQRFIAARVGIKSAASLGGTGLPATATALDLLGGNPALKPEHATSWSATIALHPTSMPRFSAEISYFHVDYRDRVVRPITFEAQALSDPIYANLITTGPTSEQITAAMATGQITNLIGRPFDPADVVAIVDDRYLNVARQLIHGVDLSSQYRLPVSSSQSILFSASGSYLQSSQRLSALQPDIDLAGRIFKPPHFRIHAGATWSTTHLNLTSLINYSGPVRDVRETPSLAGRSMTTADLVLRYHAASRIAAFGKLDFTIAVRNLLDTKPPIIADTQVYEQPYDATNYSPVGRFVSLNISKSW